jgi:hypothetical protein
MPCLTPNQKATKNKPKRNGRRVLFTIKIRMLKATITYSKHQLKAHNRAVPKPLNHKMIDMLNGTYD